MASNTLASIAAATAAGWKRSQPAAQGKFTTRLTKQLQGVPGVSGSEYSAEGESTVSQAAADTAALAACNGFRIMRYGTDSTGVNTSPLGDGNTSPSSQGVVRTHQNLTKDSH